MIDRTSKFLLSAIALLLLALLLRPMLISTPVQAQTMTAPVPAITQMAVSNGTIYLLQSGKLSVYELETPTSKELAKEFSLLPNKPNEHITLNRVIMVDVNKPQ